MFSRLCFIFLLCVDYSYEMTPWEISKFNNGVSINSVINSSHYLIEATGLPNHSTQKVNPNSPTDQNHRFWIPKDPMFAAKPTCLPMGSIAISKNGVSMFNPLTIDGHNAVEGPNKETFDSCNGHPTRVGTYHYHQLPNCLYNGTPDEFLGVAFDGFSIYGPNATDLGREVKNSDLDACHGRNSTINGVKAYRYYITREYPYILGCFKGSVAKQSGIRGIDMNVKCSPTEEACNCLQKSGDITQLSSPYMVSGVLMVALYAMRFV